MKSSAFFETSNANRYLGTLCKHFGHKVPTTLEDGSGSVELPFARCDMTAGATGLELTVIAATRTDLSKATNIVGSHLERFAFRENPEVVWQFDASGTA